MWQIFLLCNLSHHYPMLCPPPYDDSRLYSCPFLRSSLSRVLVADEQLLFPPLFNTNLDPVNPSSTVRSRRAWFTPPLFGSSPPSLFPWIYKNSLANVSRHPLQEHRKHSGILFFPPFFLARGKGVTSFFPRPMIETAPAPSPFQNVHQYLIWPLFHITFTDVQRFF